MTNTKAVEETSVQNLQGHEYSFTVFPDMLNYGGTLFGGKLLAEMDLAASNTARRLLYGTQFNGLVTAHVSEVDFLMPAHLGDIVSLSTRVVRVGRTSLTIQVSALREDLTGEEKQVCQALFVMVAMCDGIPFGHGLNEQEE